jgi:hypothetical protein
MSTKKKRSHDEHADLYKERITNIRKERIDYEKNLAKIDTSSIEDAPECLLYGARRELCCKPEVLKMGFVCAPFMSKCQALHLQLSGWTRHPHAGSGGHCSLGGQTMPWWEDVFYRRAGEAVLVLATAYIWDAGHDRPSIKEGDTTPEVLINLLRENLHPKALIDDVQNIELSLRFDNIVLHKKQLGPLLYIARKPSPELWAITDPKLNDPHLAYEDWAYRKFY